MRKTKFRAWDKEKKQWYQPVHEAYKGNLWELMVGFSGDLLAHTMEAVSHESTFPNRYELTQYTGFDSKSGVSIFDGDLVVKPPNGFEPREITEVRWSEEDGCWEVYEHDLLAHHYKDLEVIGNKWENGDLLK